jgi:hypothetical protein
MRENLERQRPEVGGGGIVDERQDRVVNRVNAVTSAPRLS